MKLWPQPALALPHSSLGRVTFVPALLSLSQFAVAFQPCWEAVFFAGCLHFNKEMRRPCSMYH